MLKLCLTLILLGTITQINCENLPAFIWGSNTPSYLPTLTTLNGDEFATLVKSQTDKDTLTVVFVENDLSVEDFSSCKLKSQTCFQNLRKIEQKTYVSSVENPVEALESAFGKHKQQSVFLSNDGELSENFDAAATEKLLFVYLDDVESSADFAKHDELMSKLYNTLAAERKNVVAIYTARHPSFVYSKPLIRKARDTEAKQEELPANRPQRVIVNPSFIIALSGLRIDADVIDVEKIELVVNETADKTSLDVNLKEGTHDIAFKLEVSGGTWWAPMITYNGQRFQSASPISAYDGKSFGCVDLRLTNAKTYIFIENVQMQPRFDTEKPALTAFADGQNDCTGFFSPAIWGALFVVIILLFILTTGLTMIMDIKTMDRFDDPKGKTITVNAQE